jgi:hypothetical protein
MKTNTAVIALLMLIAACAEFGMGRKIWGTSGSPGLWSGDIWSSHNSQYLLDPYTFTHISHGVLFYGILAAIAGRLPIATRLVLAVTLESGWEVLENTNMVIERYRAATISLNYYGDSIVNSMADIVACIAGFAVASRLPKRATILGFVAVEIILALWIRDNLALNILMLIHPSRAIQAWQLGK